MWCYHCQYQEKYQEREVEIGHNLLGDKEKDKNKLMKFKLMKIN